MQPIDTKPQSGNLTQASTEKRQVYTAPILISICDSETEFNVGIGNDGAIFMSFNQSNNNAN